MKRFIEKIKMFIMPLEFLPQCPDLFCTYRKLAAHPRVKRKPGGWIYKGKFYPDYLTVGGASFAIFSKALKLCRGKGIDIGAGYWPLPGSIPIDSRRGEGYGKDVSDYEDNSLDYVFSSHCLEHIQDWKKALYIWIKKLKTGGIIFLYLPHHECSIWHPDSPFVGKSHKWVPTPEIIKSALQELGCEIIDYDDGPDVMQSFYVCAKRAK